MWVYLCGSQKHWLLDFISAHLSFLCLMVFLYLAWDNAGVWNLMLKRLFSCKGNCLLCLKAGKELQVYWCIGELNLRGHIIISASVWKLSDHSDVSRRWLTVPSSSHTTAFCQIIQLCNVLLSNRLFTSLLLLCCWNCEFNWAALCFGRRWCDCKAF